MKGATVYNEELSKQMGRDVWKVNLLAESNALRAQRDRLRDALIAVRNELHLARFNPLSTPKTATDIIYKALEDIR